MYEQSYKNILKGVCVMNIARIKERAEQLLSTCDKAKYQRVLIIIMLIGLIQTFLLDIPAFYLISYLLVTIIFLTFPYAYVVTGLKVVRNNDQALEDSDAWVGFKRFKELFPTYFLSLLIYLAIIIVVGIIAVFLFSGTIGMLLMHTKFNNFLDFIMIYPQMIGIMFLFALIIFAIVYYVSLHLFAFPYLMEQYGMRNGAAIKESFRFMKGYKMSLFKLDLSFLGWILLIALLEGAILGLLGESTTVTLLASGLAGVASVYTYMPKYQLSRAIFFEEIAYRRYEQVDESDNMAEDETCSQES